MKIVVLKTWLSSTIISPFLYIILMSISERQSPFFGLFIIGAAFGLIYSIPALGIFYFISELINSKLESFKLKLPLFVVALDSLIVLTFYFLLGPPDYILIQLISCYLLTSSISCIYFFRKYEIKRSKETVAIVE